jgi:hypothetical protein
MVSPAIAAAAAAMVAESAAARVAAAAHGADRIGGTGGGRPERGLTRGPGRAGRGSRGWALWLWAGYLVYLAQLTMVRI